MEDGDDAMECQHEAFYIESDPYLFLQGPQMLEILGRSPFWRFIHPARSTQSAARPHSMQC